MKLADRLRGERKVAARGHLSLDREKAREKLRMFRLPDPHFYVLQFVRAASVLGATTIDFQISTRTMTCTFDRVLSPELLADIWGVAFEERTDDAARAAHYVALGIGSAQALNPDRIEIESGDMLLVLTDDREESARFEHHTIDGTRIRVHEKFKLGHIVEFLNTLGGKHAEEFAIRDRCAFTPMRLQVNGERVAGRLSDLRVEPLEFGTATEIGVVALDPLALDGWCVLLKDGVGVSRVEVPNHGRAGRGALQSTRFQTDLSGFGLIKDEYWGVPFHHVFMPSYHVVLRRFLESEAADDADALDALAELADYAREMEGRLQEPTRELFEWLCRQPLFEDATKPPSSAWVSVDDATWPALVRYSEERFPNVDSPRPVLLVEPSGTGGMVGVRERMLRESVVAALAHSRIRGSINATAQLRGKMHRKRNLEIWEARPAHDYSSRRFEHLVQVDDARGAVYKPTSTRTMSAETSTGCLIYLRSKLLRHTKSDVPVWVEIDGDFRTNSLFDDVVRDDRFERLAVELCAGTLELHRAVAEHLISEGADETDGARLLDQFVLRLCRGEWCGQFLKTLGYLPQTDIPDILDRHAQRLSELTWFAAENRVDDVLERLGPLAQVPSYELASGERLSLSEIVRRDELSLLKPEGDWREFLRRVGRDLGDEVLGSVVLVDDIQTRLIRAMREYAPDTRLAIDELYARKRFFARSAYVEERPTGVVDELEASSDWFDATIYLRPGGSENQCYAKFIWHERFLAQRVFPVPIGSFSAVVHCDELQPSRDYEDLDDPIRLPGLLRFLRDKCAELLDQWWVAQRESAEFGSLEELNLFIRVSLELAPKHPDRRIIPVLRKRYGVWAPEFASRVELRRAAATHGLVLSYTSGVGVDDSALPSADASVVRLGDTEPGELGSVLGSEVRFVDATPRLPASVDSPRDRFLKKSSYPKKLRGAAIEWTGVIDGIHCVTGLIAQPDVSLPAIVDLVDLTSAGGAELTQLDGIGPALAAGILEHRAEHGFSKREDLLNVSGIGPATFEQVRDSIHVGDDRPTGRTSNIVAVLVEGRRLESLDIETPFGKFRSVMWGDPIVPDPTWKFAAGGRRKLLLATYHSAANTIREACRTAAELGFPPAEVMSDLRRFLARCILDEPKPPFDLRKELGSIPLFETLDGSWIAFDDLETLAEVGVIEWATRGNRPRTLKLSSAEALAPLLKEFSLSEAEPASVWLDDLDTFRGGRNGSQLGASAHELSDEVLEGVVALLVEARGDRLDLFDDNLAGSVRWGDPGDRLCAVSNDGVELNESHPLARAVASGDPASTRFLASVVYSAINAYYREITDHDELELQSRLVRGRRG